MTTERPGYAGWLSRRVASGAWVTSSSHSRFEEGNYRQFFPTLPFTAARAHFRHPDFLGGVYGLPRESRLLSPTLGSAAYCSATSHSLRSAFSRCAASSYPMALGVARDDPLAGAPAHDAHFIESERASAPKERRVQMNSGVPIFGCPEPFCACPSVTVFGFSADEGRRQRFSLLSPRHLFHRCRKL